MFCPSLFTTSIQILIQKRRVPILVVWGFYCQFDKISNVRYHLQYIPTVYIEVY